MTGMRKFWIALIWGVCLVGVLITLLLILKDRFTEGMLIAWLAAFGGVFIFFVTGNVAGNAITSAITAVTPPPESK